MRNSIASSEDLIWNCEACHVHYILSEVTLCLTRAIGYVEWYREVLIGATRTCVKFRDLGTADCTVSVGYPKVTDEKSGSTNEGKPKMNARGPSIEDDVERCWRRSD